MLQKQNILRIFFAAVFCLAFFGAAGKTQAVAPPMIVNSDHTVSINGEKVFPVSMYALCSRFFESDSNCDDSLAINNNKTFHFSNGCQIYGSDALGYSKYIPKFEKAGVGTGVLAISLPIPFESGGNSPYIYLSQLTANEKINKRGIDEADYANLTQRNQVINNYNKSKTNMPTTMIYMNNYDHLVDWLPYVDIYGYDGYANTNEKFASYYARADVVYAHERWFMQWMGNRKWTDSVFNNKAVWTVIAAYATYDPSETVLTEKEARAMTWDSIASGSQGISYYGWLPYSGVPSPGVWSNATIAGWYRGFATEIRSLNNILILPTKSLFWENEKNTTFAEVSPNPTKTIYSNWPVQHQFVYLLKQPTATKSFLIVVNKDIKPTTGTTMWVKAFTSGTQTVKKLISGSGSWQTMTATAGKWTDNFAGYGVHIYKICNVGDPCDVPPPPAPTTPTLPSQPTSTLTSTPTLPPTPAYVTPTLYCLGLGIKSCLGLTFTQTPTPTPSNQNTPTPTTPTPSPITTPPIIGGAALLVFLFLSMGIYYLLKQHKA